MNTIFLGMPVRNEGHYLREAVTSLLQQTYGNFRLVVFDNASQDGSSEMIQQFAQTDTRITISKSEKPVGMIEAFRRVFFLAEQQASFSTPGGHMRYFAWAAGHDLWAPTWLERLYAELQRNTDLCMVYPVTSYVDREGKPAPAKPTYFQTTGIQDPLKRFYYTCRNIKGAGNMAYGLFRSDALREVGVYRPVYLPDRLLFIEIALQGQVKQIQETLWFRRVTVLAGEKKKTRTLDKQKESLFTDETRPSYFFLPWWIIFTLSFIKNYVFFGKKPLTGRPVTAFILSVYLLVSCILRQTAKRVRVWSKKIKNNFLPSKEISKKR